MLITECCLFHAQPRHVMSCHDDERQSNHGRHGLGIRQTLEGSEKCVAFVGKPEERDHLEDLGEDGQM